ncbi:FISUMP domain-containing protein [Bacteroidota bacterium]
MKIKVITRLVLIVVFTIGFYSCSGDNKKTTKLEEETTCPKTISYVGKTYNTVLIGDQCWLRENLDIGTMIDSLADATDNGIIEKYCYGNDPSNCETYGGLYAWDEAMQYSTTPGAQGICPDNWHIPTLAEFDTLIKSVNDDGNALKEVNQGLGEGRGTDTSGFSALMAGRRDYSRDYYGYFYYLGYRTYFWSSSEHGTDPDRASTMSLFTSDSIIYFTSSYKYNGFSVRCVKD